jgi:hypothetical protein
MIDTEELKGIDGMSYIASAPNGETITGMAVCGDKLFVSTGSALYVLTDDKRLEKFDIKESTWNG